mgnify:CR=1 FL=1
MKLITGTPRRPWRGLWKMDFGVWELFLKSDLSSSNLKEISFVKGGSFRA